jgi:hypothetical protein
MAQWTLVFSSTGLPEAELVRGLLIAHDIEAIVIDQRPSAYPTLAAAEVYVDLDDVLRARFIVQKHQAP